MIKVIDEYKLDSDIIRFISDVVGDLRNKHQRPIRLDPFDYLAGGGRIALYYDNLNNIKGISMVSVKASLWVDGSWAYQDLLYGLTPRACYELVNDIIEFGRNTADNIVIVTNGFTNIKESSLIKRGFSKLETVYSMEV